MTSQRFISVAAVSLTAVLSAVFVAAAPVQAQGMVSTNCRLASVELRDEASVGLALRAGSPNAGKPMADPALARIARSSGA